MGSYTVLGLDLGAQSVGWTLLEYKKDNPARIVDMGARIFEAGVEGDLESGKEESKTTDRREARLRRRQAERRSRRMENLACLLRRHGFLPKGKIRSGKERHELLAKLDKEIYDKYRKELGEDNDSLDSLRQLPYFLRARALDHKLAPCELGRALYHLAQRRGYLSNRKAQRNDSDKDSGKVEPAIHSLREKMEADGVRTLGEYLAKIDPFEEQRLRQRWTARSMYKDEFEAIWAAQKKHHRKKLHDTLKKEVYNAIFFQRPLKSQKRLIGECDLVAKKKRAPKALLLSQRFRYLQKLNDLRVTFPDGVERELTDEERNTLIPLFEGQANVSFAAMRKPLKFPKTVEFNFEKSEKNLPGNVTRARLEKIFGARWEKLDAESQNTIVGEVMGALNPDTLAKRGEFWGLDPEAAAEFGKVQLESGYVNLSREAMRELLPLMEQGMAFRTAVTERYGDQWAKTALEKLPPLIDAVPTVRNPAVTRTLTEMRKVINAVIDKHGKPTYTRIELARELKKNAKARNEIFKNNRKRRMARETIRESIQKHNGDANPSRRDIERVLLWQECNECCPYTGKKISFASLLSPESSWDIEHIIPFSRCLDDSFFNKTLCYHEENQHVKKNQTPYEAYEATAQWEDILSRVKQFKGDAAKEKLKRFQQTNLDDFEDFSARKLNDTRYASKLAAQYVSWLYGEEARKRVQVSTGQITAYLRGAWKLNQILNDGDNSKTRADHRHHAVDALVVALIDHSTVKRLADAAKKQQFKNGRYNGFTKRFGRDEPWEGFLDDVYHAVDNITVSHRVSRKISGCLHDDTIYSPPQEDEKGKEYVKVRKYLGEKFGPKEIQKVVDPEIQRILQSWLDDHHGDSKAAFADPDNHPYLYVHNEDSSRGKIPIHKVRMKEYREVQQIGKDHRSRHVWPRANNHIEIFALHDKDGNVKKWEGRVVSKLDVHQRKKQGLPIIDRHWDKQHTFLFSLTQGDTIEVDVEISNDETIRELYYVRGISNQLTCSHISDARKKGDIPGKQTENEKTRFLLRPYVTSLQKLNCKKTSISPLGEIYLAND